MMLRPLAVARYGVFAAVIVAALSVWLGQRAGASLDYALMRGVVAFVVVVGLALAAEFVLTTVSGGPAPAPPAREPRDAPAADEDE